MMQVEELLLVRNFVVDDTDSSCCEDNISILSVPQISSSVETTEAVGPLERQVVGWCLSHGSLKDMVVRFARIDLAAPHIHATSLVSFVHHDLAEFVVSASSSKTIVIVVIVVLLASVLVEVFLIFVFGDQLRLLGSFCVHEILPLEDCLVLATCRDEVLLTYSVPGELNAGDVLRVASVLLVGSLVDWAGVLEELDHAEVISCS